MPPIMGLDGCCWGVGAEFWAGGEPVPFPPAMVTSFYKFAMKVSASQALAGRARCAMYNSHDHG